MKMLLSMNTFKKLQDYIIETMIDTGYICETPLEAREYVDKLINIETITDIQYNLLIEKIIDYSDEMLDTLQK